LSGDMKIYEAVAAGSQWELRAGAQLEDTTSLGLCLKVGGQHLIKLDERVPPVVNKKQRVKQADLKDFRVGKKVYFVLRKSFGAPREGIYLIQRGATGGFHSAPLHKARTVLSGSLPGADPTRAFSEKLLHVQPKGFVMLHHGARLSGVLYVDPDVGPVLIRADVWMTSRGFSWVASLTPEERDFLIKDRKRPEDGVGRSPCFYLRSFLKGESDGFDLS